jgi:hypothetical protein
MKKIIDFKDPVKVLLVPTLVLLAILIILVTAILTQIFGLGAVV